MKLTSIIFEGFRENPSIINGKKYSVDWIGTADTLLDFTRALDKIPDTIFHCIVTSANLVPFNSIRFSSLSYIKHEPSS